MQQDKCIVPIVAIDAAGNIKQFLGTGSFVGESLLLTADHVIRDWSEEFAITVLPDIKSLFRAKVVHRDTPHDLALLQVDGYSAPEVLKVGSGERILTNQLMLTFEYGTTRTSGRAIELSPATRMGNITRVLNLQARLGLAGDAALELSFPALRGASGAPVVSSVGFELVGVIVANVSYHLLPSQIESVLDESNSLMEETKFMLPQAVAVNCRHVSIMMSAYQQSKTTGSEPQVADP